MKKDRKNDLSVSSGTVDIILGDDDKSKIYSHAVFCQCILPVRSLPKEETYYHVEHGNTSLVIQSGIIRSESGQIHKMEVPAGPKARLLFPYIIDQVKRTGNPIVDMGKNLREYMIRNNIPVGGQNAKEITRQVYNIAASNIYLGISGETATHKFSTQKNYRVASEVSFWTEKQPEQLSIWSPYLTVSDEFMAAVDKHTVLLNLRPLIELQANPRAMDMYTWLSYRVRTVKYPVKISYRDLHSVFGKQTKTEKDFKKNFKAAIKQAIPYISQAHIDLESDKNHIILRNTSSQHFYLPGVAGQGGSLPVAEGVFGELKDIGLSVPAIDKITKQYEPDAIKKAAAVTKQNIEAGKVKNPPGFFTKALKEGWEPAAAAETAKETLKQQGYDAAREARIKPLVWRKVRKALSDMLGEAIFASWIMDLSYVSQAEGKVVLKTSGRFTAQTIENQYLHKIEVAWKQVSGETVTVTIVVGNEPATV